MKTLYLLLLLIQPNRSDTYSARELEEIRETKERWHSLATQPLPKGELDDYLNKLGQGLRGSSTSKDDPTSDRGQIHFLLKAKFLSITGHAEYYRDRINSSRLIMEEARATGSPHYGIAMGDMNKEREWGFQTLRELPSVETVRVLGEFLSDDRGAGLTWEESRETGEAPNQRDAVVALSRLGIENGATTPIGNSDEIDPGLVRWQQWYAEVKSGRRTFRFIGDTTEYDLRGPSLRGAREPETRSGKRTDNKSDGELRSKATEEKTKPLLPYLLGFFFLAAGAAFYFLKRVSPSIRNERGTPDGRG